jgi:tetratricopeptide (TPR) repeat protein
MHTPRSTLTCSFCCVLLLAHIWALPAQSPPQPAPAQVSVYIVEFTQALGPELDRDFNQLNRFTTGLVQLRLLQIPSLIVHRVPDPMTCAKAQPLPTEPRTQTASLNTQAVGDFYLIEGSIKPDLPEITLNYSVKQCQSGRLQTVFQDVQPFTLDHALDEITIVAHAIAYKIEQSIPPTQVDVSLFSVDSDAATPRTIVTELQKSIVSELEKSSDYEVKSPSEFKIVGQLMVQKQRFLGTLPGKLNLTAQMHVETHGKTYPLHTITGNADQLQNFYAAVSKEVAGGLPEVLLAEHLQISGFLESMKTEDLMNEGNRLLDQCTSAETQCSSAQDAITLLSPAAKKDSAPWKLLLLLGIAQVRAGKSADAIASFEDVLRRFDDEKSRGNQVQASDQIELLNLLGDSYRGLGRYDLAEESYRSSLELNESQGAVYKNLAAVLQYKGQRAQALDVLIAGLRLCSPPCDPRPLHNSAKDLILAIQNLDEIARTAASIHSALDVSVPVTNEYALVTARKWTLVLDSGWKPEDRDPAEHELQAALGLPITDPEVQVWLYGVGARVELESGDSVRLQQFVDLAERVPTAEYPAYLHEWVERLSARDYMEHGQPDLAREKAEQAYHIQPSDQGTSVMAIATYYSGRCREITRYRGDANPDPERCKPDNIRSFDVTDEKPRLSPAERKEIDDLYIKAANLLGPLVAKGQGNYDGILMWSNHQLGRDRQTVDLYFRLGQKDSTNQQIWNIILYVCSQFLVDMDCALSAAQKAAETLPRTGSNVARDFLNIAEVAVMDGNQKQALDWLSIVASQPSLSPADKSLLHLYHLWAIMPSGRPEEMKSDFEAWQTAANEFRSQRDGLGWVFGGARRVLSSPSSSLGEEKTSLLTSMMDALEQRDSKMPAWPDRGLI